MNDGRELRGTNRLDTSRTTVPRGISAILAAAIGATVLAGSLFVLRWTSDEPADSTPPPPALHARRDTSQNAVRLIPRRRTAAHEVDERGEPRLPPVRQSDDAGDTAAMAHDSTAESDELVIDNVPGREYPRGIDAADYIQALRDMGEAGGLAAFNPPGTSPPKAGIVVPDDYTLPEGFARYHQSTDDGIPLAPILIYSPEYDFFDAEGNPIEIPDDRVVPEELAPVGMPVEILDPDQPREPTGLIGQEPE